MTDRGGNACAFPSLVIVGWQKNRPTVQFQGFPHDVGFCIAFYPYMVYNKVGFDDCIDPG